MTMWSLPVIFSRGTRVQSYSESRLTESQASHLGQDGDSYSVWKLRTGSRSGDLLSPARLRDPGSRTGPPPPGPWFAHSHPTRAGRAALHPDPSLVSPPPHAVVEVVRAAVIRGPGSPSRDPGGARGPCPTWTSMATRLSSFSGGRKWYHILYQSMEECPWRSLQARLGRTCFASSNRGTTTASRSSSRPSAGTR